MSLNFGKYPPQKQTYKYFKQMFDVIVSLDWEFTCKGCGSCCYKFADFELTDDEVNEGNFIHRKCILNKKYNHSLATVSKFVPELHKDHSCCVYYDPDQKICLDHENRPNVCRKFSCYGYYGKRFRKFQSFLMKITEWKLIPNIIKTRILIEIHKPLLRKIYKLAPEYFQQHIDLPPLEWLLKIDSKYLDNKCREMDKKNGQNISKIY